MSIRLSINKTLFSVKGEFSLEADFSIENGQFLSFYGPSGVGKTTLLRFIAGLTNADEGFLEVNGQVWYDSKTKKNLPPQQRRVGFVFQDYALFPNMSIKENIRFAQSDKDDVWLKELLEIFDLTALQNRKPSVLSGGQQQRVALARAIALKPDILLLDEPLSALDSELRKNLQNTIMEVHKRWGITTVLVSHDITEVFRLCSRVIVLNNGKIENDGDPFNIFSRHKISGKVQFVAEVIRSEKEDILKVLTLLIGNSPVKVVVHDIPENDFKVGEKVLVISKAFNPIIQRI